MIKIIYALAGAIAFLGIGCTEQPALVLEGSVEGVEGNQIYLYTVKNESYQVYEVLDSATIQDGHFRLERKELHPELYFLGKSDGQKATGGLVFLEPGKIKAIGKVDAKDQFAWTVEGSVNQELYARFNAENYSKTGQQQLDSLDELFFAAREKEDREEMARVKEASLPLYYCADSLTQVLARQYVNENKDKALGLYLYKRYLFPREEYNDTLSIHNAVDYIQSFGEEAHHTAYYDYLINRLNRLDRCAIGRVAPEVAGLDTLGNPMKLSDFRGKYVLVDFWNSYCHWCREESPNMRRALAECGDNFTILGVSNDSKKELWMDAIHTDQAYWNHVLIDRVASDALYNTYCITGIPHIILVNPDGVIVAKEVRGEDIINVPKKFIGI